MTRKYLAWPLRVLIAVVPSTTHAVWIYGKSWSLPERWLHDAIRTVLRMFVEEKPVLLLPWQQKVAAGIAYALPEILLAVSIYALLTWWVGPKSSAPGETRCRKCDYILRGLSEPRCPECGERI
jgi:hypothetical protein